MKVAPRYVAAIVLGAACVLGLWCSALLLLRATGHLPPPPISNSLCLDEKLSFLRDHMPPDPNLLVIGSSVAWRHFDGEVAKRTAPGTQPFNAGFCGLKANQSVDVAQWLLPRLPHVTRVVMIAAPQDFTHCAGVPPAFDTQAADRLVFEHAAKWPFYLHYFDPMSLVRNAWHVAAQRENRVPLDPLVFTEYGDGPLDTTASRELVYGKLRGFDPVCCAAVRELAHRLAGEQRAFSVVTTPLNPVWKHRFDPAGQIIDEYDHELASALFGTGASQWDAGRHSIYKAQLFTDAIHMRWSGAQRFSADMLRKLHVGP